MINGVYGFQSFLLGLAAVASSPAGDRRNGLGIKLAQKDGLATRGRCDDEDSDRSR